MADIEKRIDIEAGRSEAAINELRQHMAKLRAEVVLAATKRSAA
jgi:hypothetical protein